MRKGREQSNKKVSTESADCCTHIPLSLHSLAASLVLTKQHTVFVVFSRKRSIQALCFGSGSKARTRVSSRRWFLFFFFNSSRDSTSRTSIPSSVRCFFEVPHFICFLLCLQKMETKSENRVCECDVEKKKKEAVHVVLQVDLHCDGCIARIVRLARCLEG